MALLAESLKWAWVTFYYLAIVFARGILIWVFLGAVAVHSLTFRPSRLRGLQGGSSGRLRGIFTPLVVGAGCTSHAAFTRIAQALIDAGRWRDFLAFIGGAHYLLFYVFLLSPLLGKEFLLAYIIGVVVFLGVFITLGSQLKRSDVSPIPSPQADLTHFAIPRSKAKAPLPFRLAEQAIRLIGREVAGSWWRLLYGFLAAGFLAAVAIQPSWVFPVTLTGGGWQGQFLNALMGIGTGLLSFAPPIANILIGTYLWRGGIALAGLVAFWFTAAAAPHRIWYYRRMLGWRLALLLAGIVLLAAILSGLTVAGIFGLLQIKIKYQYAIAQTL
ncbi:MAG: hypothetical protein ACE5I9_09020 [Candidatus Methylomirabilales bacterium]